MDLPIFIDVYEPCVLVSAAEYNNLTSLAQIARGKVLMEESDYNSMDEKVKRLEYIEQAIKNMLNLCKNGEFETYEGPGEFTDRSVKPQGFSLGI